MKEEEMELSLELSIGGCYKNIENSRTHESENGKIHEVDENNTSSRSDVSENYAVGCVQDENFSSDSADPRKRREIQALRRREAIMKREEKQKRWARSKGGVNDRIYLEMQQNQGRVIDRGRRENESSEELLMKKARGNMNGDGKDICFNNMVQPVTYNKCFKVFQNGNSCGDSNLEHRNQRIVSNGLLERSSSVFLDHQSTSHKARSSSTDTGSHSNYSQGGQQQSSATATSNTPERSDLNGPSSNARSDKGNGKTANLLPKISSSDVPTPECSNPRKCDPLNNPTPTAQEQTSSASKLCNESAIKPPISQSNNPNSSAVPRMPLVSTTGNGPNGKTVNGFLYSYSKSEVSIICVCHGSSFSPAEFVEHAGGIEISHPLKHITIVPTPFG